MRRRTRDEAPHLPAWKEVAYGVLSTALCHAVTRMIDVAFDRLAPSKENKKTEKEG